VKLGEKIPLDPKNKDHYDKTKYKITPGDVFVHTMKVLDNIESKDWRVRLAALFHDIGKPATAVDKGEGRISNKGHDKEGAKMVFEIGKRLSMSNENIALISNLVKDHMNFKEVKNMKRSTLRRFLSKPHIVELIELSKADSLGTDFEHDMSFIDFAKNQLKNFDDLNEPVMPDPFVDGHDLIAMGFKPSPKFKVMLDKVMDLQLENKINSKEEGIDFIVKKFI